MTATGFLRNKPIRAAKHGWDGGNGYSGFANPSDAPLDKPVTVQVTDGNAAYIPPFQCKRTEQGWVTAHKGTPLTVQVIGWKPGQPNRRW